MLNHHPIKVLLIFCLALTGCVSSYKPNAPTASSASFTLVRGSTHLGAKSLQEYEAYQDARCTPVPGTGRLAALLTYASQRKSVQVDATRPIYVLARTSLHGTAPRRSDDDLSIRFYLTTDSCSNLVSFTPQPSRQYEITQEATTTNCSVTVIDIATNSPPDDIKVEDARTCPVAGTKS